MGAPLNPVPQVMRFFMEGFIDGDDVYKWGNVLYFRYTGGAPSNTDCANFAGDLRAQWFGHVASLCPSPTTLQHVTCTDLTSDSAGSGEDFNVEPGSRGDDSIPANACVLISYPVATRYKGGHPRSYLYVGGNADLEGAAHWAPAFVTEVQTHWRAFLTAMIGDTNGSTTIADLVAVRYRGKFLPNGGPPHFYLDTPIATNIDITEATAQAEMASQRRRIGRRRA
jgi:hypothetical protein